jgi:signal transduction histidine kinase
VGDPGAPLVLMDPHRLEQVIVNLLLNSLHAIEAVPNPSIRVTVLGEGSRLGSLPIRREGDPPGVNYRHRRRVASDRNRGGPDSLYTAERVAVIQVEDNGPGIAEENLEQIFDPFFTTKEPGEGTGLGLAICARLVEGIGGRITAGNRGVGGAIFTIRLPGVSSEVDSERTMDRRTIPAGPDAGRYFGGAS